MDKNSPFTKQTPAGASLMEGYLFFLPRHSVHHNSHRIKRGEKKVDENFKE